MRLLALLLGAVLACSTPAAHQGTVAASPASLAPASVGPFPAPRSAEGHADLAIVLWLQRTRSPADVARAGFHASIGLDRFAPAFSPSFDAGALPATRALVDRAHAFARRPLGEAKAYWARPRPYEADARVVPSLPHEPSFAYPSGHATRAVLVARVLAELAPERREALLAIGRRIGYDRVVGGVHYPSDVLAGEKLGNALADAFLADPENRRALEDARAREWGRGEGEGAPRLRGEPLIERPIR